MMDETLQDFFTGDVTQRESVIITNALQYLELNYPDAHLAVMQVCRDKKSVRQITGNNEAARKAFRILLNDGREFVHGWYVACTIND